MVSANLARVLPALPGGLLAAVLLIVQLPADPASGVTFSTSPWTDEAWSVLGARNLVLLGTWTTDDLAMHVVQLPYQLAVTGVFELFGVGIVQARALSVVLSVAAVVLAALVTARHFAAPAGIVAGIALATSPLLVYYGRLAYLEPMVTFALTAGAAILLSGSPRRAIALGAVAGGLLALAVGTKPSAIAAALGILAGAALAGRTGVPKIGTAVAAAVAVIVVAGIGWAALIGIPQRDAVDTAFRFWPAQPIPETPLDWVVRVGRYVRASDGANTLTLPLIVGAGVGTVVAARRWRSLTPGQRMLVGAAVGWVALGMLFIVLSAYRPNRYVVPVLPALAMLAGAGVSLLLARLDGRGAFVRAALVAAALAAPGIALWAGWQASASYRLPEIQAEVARLIGSNGAVEGGLAPAFAMRAPVPAILSRPALEINGGDLYADEGVRWLVADETYEPIWASAHPDAWARREVVRCFGWGPDDNECLIRIP